jgi:hypothetical protein
MCTATIGSPGHTRKLRYAVVVYRNSSLLISEWTDPHIQPRARSFLLSEAWIKQFE